MYNLHSTNEIIFLLFVYSYYILFPLVVLEGPLVTIIAGFLVSVGFLDAIPTYLVVILGDLTGDIIYYSAGRWWLRKPSRALFSLLGLKDKTLEKIEKLLRSHEGKVLFFGKLSHAIGGPILFAAGQAKIRFKKFVWFNFLATLPKTLILMAVGYYFGSAISNFKKYVDFTVIGLFVVTVVFIGLYLLVTKVSRTFIEKLDKS